MLMLILSSACFSSTMIGMQPQQPAPTVSGPSGQYDFIVNAGKGPSNNWLVTAPLKTRVIVVAVGGLVLLLILWIGFALLTASASGSVQNFTTLAQEQTELMRISQDPAHNATLEPTQSFAQTTELSVTSDRRVFLAYLKELGSDPTTQVLAAQHSSTSDAQLAAAKQAGTYDQTYVTITLKELTTYAGGLKRAFDATSNPKERQLLRNAYQHAQLLITLSKQNS